MYGRPQARFIAIRGNDRFEVTAEVAINWRFGYCVPTRNRRNFCGACDRGFTGSWFDS